MPAIRCSRWLRTSQRHRDSARPTLPPVHDAPGGLSACAAAVNNAFEERNYGKRANPGRRGPAHTATIYPGPPTGATNHRRPSRTGFSEQRLHSLDTYRGLIMVALAFNGFGLAATARNHLRAEGPSPFWEAVFFQFSHVEWVGCRLLEYHPALVHVHGRRGQRRIPLPGPKTGQSPAVMFGHVLWRSLLLVFLGIFLVSNYEKSTNWTFMNVLTQIGLAYPGLYLLWGKSVRTQAIATALLLAGVWLLYVVYPTSGIDLVDGVPAVSVSAASAQEHLTGLAPMWHKNANVGHAIDLWLLNLLPRSPSSSAAAVTRPSISYRR